MVHRRGVEAAGGEFEHSLDLLLGHVELLDDFVDGGTSFEVSKTVATGMRVSRNTHAPLRLSGTLSTAGHWDQSRIAMGSSSS